MFWSTLCNRLHLYCVLLLTLTHTGTITYMAFYRKRNFFFFLTESHILESGPHGSKTESNAFSPGASWQGELTFFFSGSWLCSSAYHNISNTHTQPLLCTSDYVHLIQLLLAEVASFLNNVLFLNHGCTKLFKMVKIWGSQVAQLVVSNSWF